ncbi:MAG: mercuric reductase [Thermomicrobiales bacterium]|nr:mercuric reductase [Thermomicrobiales bacterium]
MVSTRYDVIVIGAGQGGGPFASACAEAGRRTALVERAHVGGTCINEGCTPTKTMTASARVAYLARRAGEYGVETGPVRVDMAAVRQRKREMVEEFRSGSLRRIEETAGLDLIRGNARFTAPHAVAIEGEGPAREISAELIVIDAGTHPAMPELPGLEEIPALDSTSIMELDRVPRHLIVLGGGAVGLEFAQMFRRFGSEVTVVQRGEQLLGREDRDVAEAVAEILREDGVALLLRTESRAVSSNGEDAVALTVRGTDGAERTIEGSHLLVATGRAPSSDGLALERAGVQTDDRGFIEVDARLATNVPGIYAIGDITGGPAFTHISYDDFRILRANLLEGGDATTEGRLVPYVVFIDPQLGRVGITEGEARKRGIPVKVATLPMASVARALQIDEPRGFLKAVVDAGSERILGFAALGVEGGEIMATVEVAMMGDLPYTALRDGIFAHPTLAEALNNLFAAIEA